jgi:hypothetical protein
MVSQLIDKLDIKLFTAIYIYIKMNEDIYIWK